MPPLDDDSARPSAHDLPRGLSVVQPSNRQMLGKLLVVVIVMFGFGWALIPLYEKICEVTGINILARQDENLKGGSGSGLAKNTQVDRARWITVEFDANTQGAWRFRPVKPSLQVHPGELTTIMYEIANQQNQAVVGQAVPGYLPLKAAEYFKKIECFCFQQQALGPHETRQFPVVFVLDPKLPKDVQRITLSYTFFEVAGALPTQTKAANQDADQAGRSTRDLVWLKKS